MDFVRINYSYVYIVLWMLYYLQEILMLRGVIAQLIFVLLMLMSFYALIQVNFRYRISPYLKWLNIMLVILSIYGLIPVIGGWTLTGVIQGMSWMNYVYLQTILSSILPVYAFYYYSIKKELTLNSFNVVFVVFLAFSIIAFYQNLFSETERLEKDEITNNAGFFFVPLIPMLNLLKLKNVWIYIFLIIIAAFMLMSMKRGAILAGGVMGILFVIHHFRGKSLRHLMNILILSIAAMYAIFLYVIEQYSKSSYFQTRVEQTLSGNSSGRTYIYENYWRYFVEHTNTLEFIIGNGANATKALLGQYAHNDWLEFAINQGVLGVVLYLVYWTVLVREWRHYRGPIECRWVLGDIIIAYFLISLYSMSFADMPIAATFCIGYCLAMDIRARTRSQLKMALNGVR